LDDRRFIRAPIGASIAAGTHIIISRKRFDRRCSLATHKPIICLSGTHRAIHCARALRFRGPIEIPRPARANRWPARSSWGKRIPIIVLIIHIRQRHHARIAGGRNVLGGDILYIAERRILDMLAVMGGIGKPRTEKRAASRYGRAFDHWRGFMVFLLLVLCLLCCARSCHRTRLYRYWRNCGRSIRPLDAWGLCWLVVILRLPLAKPPLFLSIVTNWLIIAQCLCIALQGGIDWKALLTCELSRSRWSNKANLRL